MDTLGEMDELEDVASKSTLEDYEQQLLMVNANLEVEQTEETKTALLELKQSLEEMLTLAKYLELCKNEHSAVNEDDGSVEDYLEEEEKRFKQELALLDRDTNIPKTHESLQALAGELCQAPHKHTWGSVAYHNALISSIEEVPNESGVTEKHVRVFFTNPTHREMQPCNYYLEGSCRFEAENCYFSHGELVPASSLRAYMPPDFERLSVKCVVLAKLDDKLWHRGRVTSIDIENKMAAVMVDSDKKERSFMFENLLPFVEEDDLDETSSSSDSDDSDQGAPFGWLEEDKRPLVEINENIMCIKPKQALGAWEKHTRGIGSKLMAKMGYIHGNGLGQHGEGIVVPISAQVLPPGRSLDVCMELRAKANGDKNLFNVERKMKRDQEKQELINARAYERECKRTDVFSFLNDSVLGQQVEKLDMSPSTSKKSKIPSLGQASTKSLNVANMKVSDDIRRKTREISQLEVSLNRQTRGTEPFKRLQLQLDAKNQELHILMNEERQLSKEQDTRKTSSKLSIF